MKFAQLQAELQIGRGQLLAWLKEGLPHRLDKQRRKVFDLDAVEQWLIAAGYADADPPADPPLDDPRILRTRNEVAEHFGVHLRTVATWLADPTFPGKPASRGRRDGFFPIEQIDRWLAAQEDQQRRSKSGTVEPSMRERLLALDYQERVGDLAPVQEMIDAVTRQVEAAKRMLLDLPDEIVKTCLPDSLSRKQRKAAHDKCTQRIRTALQTLAEALEGEGEGGQ